jgi:hypothetical protein
MQCRIPLPGSLYIETAGRIVSRGKVARLDPTLRNTIDTWSAHRQINDPTRLHTLTYPGRSLHSGGIVDLCRRLAMSRPASKVTFVYAHRGYHCNCKTPLLQSLLAKLPPGLQVHGLRVEQDHLPLDVVLLGAATLGHSDCCFIVKDNAIRLGTTEVVPMNSAQYLVLSRSPGPWAIDDILLMDDNQAFPFQMPAIPLESFVAAPHRHADSLSLVSRMTTGRQGIIKIRRVSHVNALGQLPKLSGASGVGSARLSSQARPLIHLSRHPYMGNIDHA